MSEIGKPILPIITGRPGSASGAQKPAAKTPAAQTGSFSELLQRSIEQVRPQQPQPITFSKHAQARTAQRGIELTETDIEKLADAVGKADDKGVTDTLVFMNNTAFIVNVPSKVVITVVDGSESDSNVFTNINGAVIV